MWFKKKKAVNEKSLRSNIESIIQQQGLVGSLDAAELKDGVLNVIVGVDPQHAPEMEGARQSCEQALMDIDGVFRSMVILTAEQDRHASAGDPEPSEKSAGPKKDLFTQDLLSDVKKVIAVASGKGGVGKSTVSFNLAVALARQGFSVGLLDADIYGPSVPKISGMSAHKPEAQGRDKLIEPIEAHGIKVMSIGFFVDQDMPIVWRGPKVQGALLQMLRDVNWGALDYLIIDMPPGTGDIQLTLAQRVKLAGAVIVSTPQDLALIDARKGIEMFRKVDVPILGLIENMSIFVCPHCGEESDIFGCGGAEKEAKKLDVPFMGAVPLDANIRKQSDAGYPVAEDVFDGFATQLLD